MNSVQPRFVLNDFPDFPRIFVGLTTDTPKQQHRSCHQETVHSTASRIHYNEKKVLVGEINFENL